MFFNNAGLTPFIMPGVARKSAERFEGNKAGDAPDKSIAPSDSTAVFFYGACTGYQFTQCFAFAASFDDGISGNQ